jgi:hypothetical protein
MNTEAADWEAAGRERPGAGRHEIREMLEAAGLMLNTAEYNRAREAFGRGAAAAERIRAAERAEAERERVAPFLDEARENVMFWGCVEDGSMAGEEIERSVLEEAAKLADEADERAAEETRAAEREQEEFLEYQQQQACLAACETAAEGACVEAGWKFTRRRCGNSSSRYFWIARLDEEGEEEVVFDLRISDHHAPNGSGWNEEKQERHNEPDVNIVIRRGAGDEYTFDLAPLMETLDY